MIVVVMGVSGSGKTTIGKALAAQTGAVFADADDFHSEANKAKMASGHPLDDEDRQPWLEAMNGLLRNWQSSRISGVLACSALKEKYREMLTCGLAENSVRLVMLDVPKEVLEERLTTRKHEFMDPHLLPSQLETLEWPKDAIEVMNNKAIDEVVKEILQKIRSLKKNDSPDLVAKSS